MTNILLAEDDVNLGYVIQDNLKSANFNVTLTCNGEEALKAFAKQKYDLCLLDVMMPKVDGFTVAEKIRSINQHVPIIFLTAKTMPEDKVKGFKLGADDYITKPFNFEELTLRIEAILKRSQSDLNNKDENTSFKIGNYTFNPIEHTLTHKEGEISLTKKESLILKFLCQHKDKVIEREIVLRSIWGNDDYFSGRSMDVFISKLRKYLAKDPRIKIINIHGVGFKLTLED